jgi:hypothetical protein
LRILLRRPERRFCSLAKIAQTKPNWHNAALSMLGSVGTHRAVGGMVGRSAPTAAEEDAAALPADPREVSAASGACVADTRSWRDGDAGGSG